MGDGFVAGVGVSDRRFDESDRAFLPSRNLRFPKTGAEHLRQIYLRDCLAHWWVFAIKTIGICGPWRAWCLIPRTLRAVRM